MTPYLLNYLCEPITKLPLELVNAVVGVNGSIESGELVTASGRSYPIINGIPRFLNYLPRKTVDSFGDEWNYFNYIGAFCKKRFDNKKTEYLQFNVLI